MYFCQILIVFLMVTGFFRSLYIDINGRSEQEPQGFAGVIATILISLTLAFVYYHAGVFSCLLK